MTIGNLLDIIEGEMLMASNLQLNPDGTWSLFSTKKGMTDLVRYEIQFCYHYHLFFNTLYFWTNKEASTCYNFLSRAHIFREEEGYKFELGGRKIKLKLTPVLLIRFVDEGRSNPDYVEESEARQRVNKD